MSDIKPVTPLNLERGQLVKYRTYAGKIVWARVRDPKPRIILRGMVHFELMTPKGPKDIPQLWIERAQG
jgi:hypothetical protein